MEHAMTVRAHDREIAEPRRSHAGLLGKWDGVVAFDVSGTVPPIDGPGPRQSRDSSRLSDDPTSWSGTTRLRWSRPGARFKRQAWSDIWCRPRLCRGPGTTSYPTGAYEWHPASSNAPSPSTTPEAPTSTGPATKPPSASTSSNSRTP